MLTKAVVSAAGRGTRMLDLSKTKPKHLIKVNGKPFLYYLLANLKKAGFSEIIMVIGYKKEVMEDFLKTYGPEFNFQKIVIIDQFDMLGDKYGTACPIECLMKWSIKEMAPIKKNESFVSVMGDSLWSVDDLKKMFIDDEFTYIAGLKHSEPEKYGVLIRNGEDYLEKIIEKPAEFVGDLINTGLYKFTPEVFAKLPRIIKSIRGEYELTDVINLLAKEKRVKIKELEDYWLDFGKPEDIPTISQFLNQNQI